MCVLCRSSSVSIVVVTCEAGRGRVRLDLVLGVVLDQLPQTPDESWMEDVKRLLGSETAMSDVGGEQIEVRLLEPLRRKTSEHFTEEEAVTDTLVINLVIKVSTATS